MISTKLLFKMYGTVSKYNWIVIAKNRKQSCPLKRKKLNFDTVKNSMGGMLMPVQK